MNFGLSELRPSELSIIERCLYCRSRVMNFGLSELKPIELFVIVKCLYFRGRVI